MKYAGPGAGASAPAAPAFGPARGAQKRVRLKVCCIRGVDEAAVAVAAGADALGLVSHMPSGPGVIDEETIGAVASWAPPAVSCFLLTCLGEADAIAAQMRRTRVSTVQVCDRPERGALLALRRAEPLARIVQVVHVTSRASIDEARAAADEADALLLDSGNPELAVKELGGTGRVHDWDVSAAIVDAVPIPVFLAGGLSAANVAQAVRHVRPFGLDVCSGVRSGGALDAGRLRQLVEALPA